MQRESEYFESEKKISEIFFGGRRQILEVFIDKNMKRMSALLIKTYYNLVLRKNTEKNLLRVLKK